LGNRIYDVASKTVQQSITKQGTLSMFLKSSSVEKPVTGEKTENL
jgi:hypothetical protein